MRKNKIKDETLQERFWRLVQKPKDGNPEACWLFKNVPNSKGYGKFDYKGEEYSAHRVALEIKLGRQIAEGLQANHINDCNKLCCNPEHLREGTCSENIKEAHRNGKCRIWTNKARKEHSAKLKGQKRTPEQRSNISKAHKERWDNMTEEERAKAIKNMEPNWRKSGKGMPKKLREQISKTMTGHPVSEETKQKMSEARRIYWENFHKEVEELRAFKEAAKEKQILENDSTT